MSITHLPDPVRTDNLDELIRFCERLAAADMLPRHYANRPANLLFAIEYAKALNVPLMTAITGIHVIDGKPAASAGLISGLIRRAGHTLRVSGDERTATATLLRSDDPEHTYSVTWTLQRAARAGLCYIKDGQAWARDRNGKPTSWEKYPNGLLKARAITEIGRDACEDVLFGLHYTPEELENQELLVPRAVEFPAPLPAPHPTQAPAAPLEPSVEPSAALGGDQAQEAAVDVSQLLGEALGAFQRGDTAALRTMWTTAGEQVLAEELPGLGSFGDYLLVKIAALDARSLPGVTGGGDDQQRPLDTSDQMECGCADDIVFVTGAHEGGCVFENTHWADTEA